MPVDGGVVVRVRAAGVNHWDVDMRNGSSGLELRLPHTPGLEVAGDVVAIGPGVTGWSVGERVMPRFLWPCRRCEWCAAHQENHCARLRVLGATEPGGYSEYVVAPASELVRLPDTVTYEEGAALQCTYGPVWHALKSRLQLEAGTTILINAAGSGVGSAGIQIAKLLGARIIASAGSDDKLARAKAEGAEAIVNYRTDDLAERVRSVTDGKGVQAVLRLRRRPHLRGQHRRPCTGGAGCQPRRSCRGRRYGGSGEPVPGGEVDHRVSQLHTL